MDLVPRPVAGVLVQRIKRFMADIRLDDGRMITAHCANTGAMREVSDPGMRVWVQHTPGPRRRLEWTWLMTELDDATLVGTHTGMPQKLVREALKDRRLDFFRPWTSFREEVPYGASSRVDFLLEGPGVPPCWLELKNVHWRRGDTACFPDTPTSRGARHLHELAAQVRAGHEAVVMFVVQRSDCHDFRIAGDLDPALACASEYALGQGVKHFAMACTMQPDRVVLDPSGLPVLEAAR